jgi:single-stranded DNA-binding protein
VTAEVIYLKKQDGSTVTTFSVATKDVRGTGEARKEYTTWHKVAVYGGLQKFAATIDKGDLVAVSGPICTQSFTGKNGKVETYAVRANTVDMLKRKNARTSDAPDEAAVSSEPSFDPDAADAYRFRPPKPAALRQNANDSSEIALVRSWSSLQ